MKKIVFAAFVLVLMLALSVFAYAAEDSFNPSLDVTEEENKITVVIEDNPAFAEYEPQLTIPCEGWYGAEVTLGGEAIDSVFADEAVTFTVARGGTYIIERIDPPAPSVRYCTLSFAVNGGSAVPAIRLEEGESVDLGKYVPQRAGYSFLGWFADAALTQPVSSVLLDNSKTVYAAWQLNYADVDEQSYYYDALLWALDAGITEGTGESSFSPEASCTRAQMVTFLWRAAGSPKAADMANPFTDVSEEDYYYDAVLWAVSQGITQGTAADTFSPDAECTRGQMAAFLYRFDGEDPVSGDMAFEDVDADSYYSEAVLWAAQENITNGTGEATFSPDANCTRAQIVTFLYRYSEQ